jgi:hypothetical protein
VLPGSVLVPLPAFLLIKETYNRLQVDEMPTNHDQAPCPPTNHINEGYQSDKVDEATSNQTASAPDTPTNDIKEGNQKATVETSVI